MSESVKTHAAHIAGCEHEHCRMAAEQSGLGHWAPDKRVKSWHRGRIEECGDPRCREVTNEKVSSEKRSPLDSHLGNDVWIHLGPGGFAGGDASQWHDGKQADCSHPVCKAKAEEVDGLRHLCRGFTRDEWHEGPEEACEKLACVSKRFGRIFETLQRGSLHVCRDGERIGKGLRAECQYCQGVAGGDKLGARLMALQIDWHQKQPEFMQNVEEAERVRLGLVFLELILIAVLGGLLLWRVW